MTSYTIEQLAARAEAAEYLERETRQIHANAKRMAVAARRAEFEARSEAAKARKGQYEAEGDTESLERAVRAEVYWRQRAESLVCED